MREHWRLGVPLQDFLCLQIYEQSWLEAFIYRTKGLHLHPIGCSLSSLSHSYTRSYSKTADIYVTCRKIFPISMVQHWELLSFEDSNSRKVRRNSKAILLKCGPPVLIHKITIFHISNVWEMFMFSSSNLAELLSPSNSKESQALLLKITEVNGRIIRYSQFSTPSCGSGCVI